MTLVITQKTDNGILSLSDTKLTFADAHSENPYFGALKSHIISPQVTFHFAGKVTWAEAALHKINELSHVDFIDVEEILLSIHIESNGETDFILADSQSCTICKISKGKSFNCERAYIGDAEAYKSFSDILAVELQKAEQNKIEEKYLVFCSLGVAFQKTLKGLPFSSVGGLDVSIFQKDCYFGYQQKVSVDIGHQKIKVGKEPTKVPFGSVEKGSFSVNFLSSVPGDLTQVLGVHLHFGNIGILWGPSHHIRPVVIQNCTHDSIVALSEKVFGAKISGMKIG